MKPNCIKTIKPENFAVIPIINGILNKYSFEEITIFRKMPHIEGERWRAEELWCLVTSRL